MMTTSTQSVMNRLPVRRNEQDNDGRVRPTVNIAHGVKPPAWVARAIELGGCGKCDHGALSYPNVGTHLPLFLADAVLQGLGAILWCDCPMGVHRSANAAKNWNAILESGYSLSKGWTGQYVPPDAIADLERQLTPTIRQEQP